MLVNLIFMLRATGIFIWRAVRLLQESASLFDSTVETDGLSSQSSHSRLA